MLKRVATISLVSMIATGLLSCGDDEDGAFVSPPNQTPSVFIFSPPTTLAFGQSALLDVEVRTPAGARSFDYLEVESVDPLGQITSFFSLNATEFGSCFSGATFCASDDAIGFEIPPFGPAGTWTLTITAFDQNNQAGSRTVFINAVSF